MDGRKFIVQLIDSDILFHEVIMNLPNNAIEFLDAFIGLNTRIMRRKEKERCGNIADVK